MKSILIIFCILFMWLVAGVSFYEIKVAAPRAKAIQAKQAQSSSQKTVRKVSAESPTVSAQQETGRPTSSNNQAPLSQAGVDKSLAKRSSQTNTRIVDVTSNDPLVIDTLARSDIEIEEAVRLDIQRAVAAQVANMP